MKMLKKVVIFTFLAVLVVSYYVHLTSKTADDLTAKVDNSTVGEILKIDMDLNYPTTPRDVVVFYSRIIKAYYEEDLSEDQLVGLAQHARAMFDDELLEYNDYESYLDNLKIEIASYQLSSKRITEYTIGTALETEFIFEGGEQYARVGATYYLREGTADRSKTNERYTLRKDEDGKWKIVYWEIAPE